jgi:hypothetical protein
VERALNVEAADPERIRGILHSTNLSDVDQSVVNRVCIEWPTENAKILAALHQAVINGTETGATVKTPCKKRPTCRCAWASQIYFAAAGVYSGWLEAGPTVR